MYNACYFILQGFLFFVLLSSVLNCVISCNAYLCNHIQRVRLPKLGFVCCLSLCCCDTPPPAGCCFLIKITFKATSLCLFHGSTPEGTQFQSAAEECSETRSVVSP